MNNMISRYPGIPPFSAEQRDVFFGRKADIDRLYNLILTENLVLLQSKSGMGKSSLINAGIIPLLQKSSGAVIHQFRFNNYVDSSSLTPIENMVNYLARESLTSSCLDKLIPNENSLWYYYKSTQIEAGKPLSFYLLFDQFEELFTYPDEYLFTFKKQMADLIFNTIPKNFQMVLNRKQKNKDFDLPSGLEIKQLYMNLDVHVLFAIRADRMSEMDKLSDYLPSILRTRFELQPLTHEQIKEAITEPAKQAGEYFSPMFEFHPEAVKDIINYLTNKLLLNAETTQLQIICQKFEKMVPRGAKPGEFVIMKEHLPKFEDIVLEFYRDNIKLLNEDDRVITEKFIEDELIKKEQRISLDRLVCLDFVGEKILDVLLKNHLLRSERNSIGGISYELAHDTLVPAILFDRKQRVEKETADKELHKKDEELRLLKENNEIERIKRINERKQQFVLLSVIILAATISIAFGIFGFVKMKQAQQSSYDLIEKDAESLKDNEEYKNAILKYKYLLSTNLGKKNKEDINFYIKLCDSLENKKNILDTFIKKAEPFIKSNKLSDLLFADSLYNEALKLNYYPEMKFLDSKIWFNKSNIKASIESALKNANTFIVNGGPEYAKPLLIEILKADKDNVEALKLLNKIKNIE